MVGIIVLVVCASAEPAGVVSSGLQGSSAKGRGAQTSIRKGVYTKAQAARGHEIYTRECSGSCHEEDLLGQDCVPPLVGPTFFSKWTQRSVGELFEKTQQSMPQTSPGSLNSQEYADVISYILSANQAPAGPTQLPADPKKLRPILILEKAVQK